MARDVTGTSRVNMFEQVKSPSGAVYQPVRQIGSTVTYQVKGTSETFECNDRRKDGATLDMMRAAANNPSGQGLFY